MDEGRGKDAWDQTVAILVKINNANCLDKKNLIADPDEIRQLNPYRAKPKQPVERRPMGGLDSLVAGWGGKK